MYKNLKFSKIINLNSIRINDQQINDLQLMLQNRKNEGQNQIKTKKTFNNKQNQIIGKKLLSVPEKQSNDNPSASYLNIHKQSKNIEKFSGTKDGYSSRLNYIMRSKQTSQERGLASLEKNQHPVNNEKKQPIKSAKQQITSVKEPLLQRMSLQSNNQFQKASRISSQRSSLSQIRNNFQQSRISALSRRNDEISVQKKKQNLENERQMQTLRKTNKQLSHKLIELQKHIVDIQSDLHKERQKHEFKMHTLEQARNKQIQQASRKIEDKWKFWVQEKQKQIQEIKLFYEGKIIEKNDQILKIQHFYQQQVLPQYKTEIQSIKLTNRNVLIQKESANLRIQTYKAEIMELNDQITRLKQSLIEQKSKIQSLKKQTTQTQDQLNLKYVQLCSQTQNSQAQNQKILLQLSKMANQYKLGSQGSENCQTIRVKPNQLEQSVSVQLIRSLKGYIDRLSQQISFLNGQISEKQSSIDLKDKQCRFEQQKAEKQIQRFKMSIEDKIQQLNAKNSESNLKIGAKQSEIKRLVQEITHLKETNEQHLNLKKNQSALIQQEVNTHQISIQNLQNKLFESQNRLLQSQNKLKQSQKQFFKKQIQLLKKAQIKQKQLRLCAENQEILLKKVIQMENSIIKKQQAQKNNKSVISNQLQQKILTLQGQISKTQQTIQRISEQSCEKQKKLTISCEQKLHLLGQKNETLTNQVHELRKQIYDLMKQSKQSQKGSSLGNNTYLQKQLQKLQIEISQKNIQIDSLTIENRYKEKRLENKVFIQEELLRLQTVLSNKQKELNALRVELGDAQRQILSNNQYKIRRQTQNRQLNENIITFDEKNKDLQEKISKARDQTNQLKIQHDQTIKKLKQATLKHNDLQEKTENFKKQNTRLKIQIQQLITDFQSLKTLQKSQKHLNFDRNTEQFSRKSLEQEKKSEQLSLKYRNLKKKYEHLTNQHNQLSTQYRQIGQKYDRAKEVVKKFHSKNTQQKHIVDNSYRYNQQILTHCEELLTNTRQSIQKRQTNRNYELTHRKSVLSSQNLADPYRKLSARQLPTLKQGVSQQKNFYQNQFSRANSKQNQMIERILSHRNSVSSMQGIKQKQPDALTQRYDHLKKSIQNSNLKVKGSKDMQNLSQIKPGKRQQISQQTTNNYLNPKSVKNIDGIQVRMSKKANFN